MYYASKGSPHYFDKSPYFMSLKRPDESGNARIALAWSMCSSSCWAEQDWKISNNFVMRKVNIKCSMSSLGLF
jgi:hypothetical protein